MALSHACHIISLVVFGSGKLERIVLSKPPSVVCTVSMHGPPSSYMEGGSSICRLAGQKVQRISKEVETARCGPPKALVPATDDYKSMKTDYAIYFGRVSLEYVKVECSSQVY
eukprot:2944072-Amphidinium_carterae.2